MLRLRFLAAPCPERKQRAACSVHIEASRNLAASALPVYGRADNGDKSKLAFVGDGACGRMKPGAPIRRIVPRYWRSPAQRQVSVFGLRTCHKIGFRPHYDDRNSNNPNTALQLLQVPLYVTPATAQGSITQNWCTASQEPEQRKAIQSKGGKAAAAKRKR